MRLRPQKVITGYVIRFYEDKEPVGSSNYIHARSIENINASMVATRVGPHLDRASVFRTSADAFAFISLIKSEDKYIFRGRKGHFYVSKAFCNVYRYPNGAEDIRAVRLTKPDRYDFLNNL